MRRWGRIAVALLALIVGHGTAAADPPKRDWRQEKCFRFTRDWDEALRRYGVDAVGAEFRRGVETFIQGQCVRNRKICPETARERELVDVLAIRVVNEGMSTTFLPFDCAR